MILRYKCMFQKLYCVCTCVCVYCVCVRVCVCVCVCDVCVCRMQSYGSLVRQHGLENRRKRTAYHSVDLRLPPSRPRLPSREPLAPSPESNGLSPPPPLILQKQPSHVYIYVYKYNTGSSREIEAQRWIWPVSYLFLPLLTMCFRYPLAGFWKTCGIGLFYRNYRSLLEETCWLDCWLDRVLRNTLAGSYLPRRRPVCRGATC
jgi:hypothetical protein